MLSHSDRTPRLSSPETLAWLREQDSYANQTYGLPSVPRARKQLALVLDQAKEKRHDDSA